MERRTFIKGLGAGAVTLMLGGCGLPGAERETASDEGNNVAATFDGNVTYRKIPHTGVEISTVSLGCGPMHESSDKNVEKMVSYAIDKGVNFLDTCMSNCEPMEAIGRGMKGKRDKVVTQMHMGMLFPGNTYTRTRNLDEVKLGIDQQLKMLGTDYTDIGMIHYVDDTDDYEAVINNGLLDYAQKLKQEGKIRMIGLSSHSVEISRKFMETNLLDVLMFSMNPAYDFTSGDKGMVMDPDRKALYEECQRRGVAITVMKAYAGGRLLSDADSPFGKAMTPSQCIQYCLDRPAVASTIIGLRNMSDLQAALRYYTATPEEKDYSFIWNANATSMAGVCIYCNHCQPCPVGIDIGACGKFYDLAKSGDAVAKEHYMSMGRLAGDCNDCGECEPRCPFKVQIREHMHEIAKYFGK